MAKEAPPSLHPMVRLRALCSEILMNWEVLVQQSSMQGLGLRLGLDPARECAW